MLQVELIAENAGRQPRRVWEKHATDAWYSMAQTDLQA